MKQYKKRLNRRGATTVEFSLVIPIIFTLVFGLVEWGRFEMVRQVTSTAAFNGARMGTLPGATSTDVENRVDEILGIYFVTGATTTATLTETDANVIVSVPMNQNGLALLRFFGDMTLQREFTLRSD